jgi:hypothetical protein
MNEEEKLLLTTIVDQICKMESKSIKKVMNHMLREREKGMYYRVLELQDEHGNFFIDFGYNKSLILTSDEYEFFGLVCRAFKLIEEPRSDYVKKCVVKLACGFIDEMNWSDSD